MPRSRNAKQWKPDAFGQDMIDGIANYVIVAERCSAHLRSFDFPNIERLWVQVQADFMANPVKYPSAMAAQNDVEGRKQFQLKCQAICFPPKSEPPRNPEDYIRMIFAAQAGMQSLMAQNLFMHPYRGEIGYRANLRALKELKGQAGYDAAVEFDSKLRNKPFDLLFETIQCRDKTSGRIMKYTVVDCGTSVLSGEYFVLQDDKGRKKQTDEYMLSCLIEGQTTTFEVQIPAKANIRRLKEAIWKKKNLLLKPYEADTLILFKVNIDLNTHTRDSLRRLDIKEDDKGVEKLKEWKQAYTSDHQPKGRPSCWFYVKNVDSPLPQGHNLAFLAGNYLANPLNPIPSTPFLRLPSASKSPPQPPQLNLCCTSHLLQRPMIVGILT